MEYLNIIVWSLIMIAEFKVVLQRLKEEYPENRVIVGNRLIVEMIGIMAVLGICCNIVDNIADIWIVIVTLMSLWIGSISDRIAKFVYTWTFCVVLVALIEWSIQVGYLYSMGEKCTIIIISVMLVASLLGKLGFCDVLAYILAFSSLRSMINDIEIASLIITVVSNLIFIASLKVKKRGIKEEQELMPYILIGYLIEIAMIYCIK